jgi:hypothetical protein
MKKGGLLSLPFFHQNDEKSPSCSNHLLETACSTIYRTCYDDGRHCFFKGAMPEKTIQELKGEREPLFQRLSNNPSQIHLALEIKLIDDQIAQCNHVIQKKTKTRP